MEMLYDSIRVIININRLESLAGPIRYGRCVGTKLVTLKV